VLAPLPGPAELRLAQDHSEPHPASTRPSEEGEDCKKRTFHKDSYRGIDIDKLPDYSNQDLMELFNARQRRKFSRGIKRKSIALLKKLRQARTGARPRTDHRPGR
jgi:hypothetical protein